MQSIDTDLEYIFSDLLVRLIQPRSTPWRHTTCLHALASSRDQFPYGVKRQVEGAVRGIETQQNSQGKGFLEPFRFVEVGDQLRAHGVEDVQAHFAAQTHQPGFEYPLVSTYNKQETRFWSCCWFVLINSRILLDKSLTVS